MKTEHEPLAGHGGDHLAVNEDYQEGELLRGFFPAGEALYGIGKLSLDYRVSCDFLASLDGMCAFHCLGDDFALEGFSFAVAELFGQGPEGGAGAGHVVGIPDGVRLHSGIADFMKMAGPRR